MMLPIMMIISIFQILKNSNYKNTESILSQLKYALVFLFDDKLVGTVSRYWVCKETRWMELGIGIYDKKFWNTGIGKVAMLQWIDRTFQDYLELEHLGLTTWSGNLGMMKLAEKLRMKKEAHIPKVRYYQGKYFDSIKYGILREDWEKINDGYYQINGNS